MRKEGKYVLSKAKIKAWLLKQEPYTVHRGVIRQRKRQKVITPYIDYQLEADIAYMTPYQKDNDGFGYFLLVIDTFSKFVWTYPLKHLRGQEVAKAFALALHDGRRPEKLRTEMGSEFKSVVFQKELKREGIEHFYSLNETKAAIAERAIKTIKSRMGRYMTTKQTHRWINALDAVTESYNGTYHRTLKKAPKDVKGSDEINIWLSRYDQLASKRNLQSASSTTRYRFRVGNPVRISHLRRAFQRE